MTRNPRLAPKGRAPTFRQAQGRLWGSHQEVEKQEQVELPLSYVPPT
jgi:hypothetical protein